MRKYCTCGIVTDRNIFSRDRPSNRPIYPLCPLFHRTVAVLPGRLLVSCLSCSPSPSETGTSATFTRRVCCCVLGVPAVLLCCCVCVSLCVCAVCAAVCCRVCALPGTATYPSARQNWVHGNIRTSSEFCFYSGLQYQLNCCGPIIALTPILPRAGVLLSVPPPLCPLLPLHQSQPR